MTKKLDINFYSQTTNPVSIEVDFENKILKNVCFCSIGETKGHGLSVDIIFLEQLLSKAGNLKVFSKHTDIYAAHQEERLADLLGKTSNERIVNGSLIGDITFIPSELTKDYIDHLLTWAIKSPTDIGLSIEFKMPDDNSVRNINGSYYPNLEIFKGIAFCEDPAATKKGLLFSSISPLTNVTPSSASKININNKKQMTKKLNAKVKGKNTQFATIVVTELDYTPYFDGDIWGIDTILYKDESMKETLPAGTYTLPETSMVITVDEAGKVTDAVEVETKEEADKEEPLLVDMAKPEAKADGEAEVALAKVDDAEVALAKAEAEAAKEVAMSAKAEAQKIKTDLAIREAELSEIKLELNKQKNKNFMSNYKTNETNVNFSADYNGYKNFKRELTAGNIRKRVKHFAAGFNIAPDVIDRAHSLVTRVFRELVDGAEVMKWFPQLTLDNVASFKHPLTTYVDMPNLSNLVGSEAIIAGAGVTCNPTYSRGLSVTQRTMPVGAWGTNTEWCPADFANAFQSYFYINNQEMPMEFAIVEYILEIALADFQNKLMVGDNITPLTNPIDGLYTQAVADVDVVKVTTVAWTGGELGNVNMQLNKIVNAMPVKWQNAVMAGKLKPVICTAPSIIRLYKSYVIEKNLFNLSGYDTNTIPFESLIGRIQFMPVPAYEVVNVADNESLVFVTDIDNVLWSFDNSTIPDRIFLSEANTIKVMLNWYGGIGYGRADQVGINEY